MDLNLAQVRAFVAVVEELHFGHAADRLALTQQALSKRVQNLEESLGTKLLIRTGRGVQLSEAGLRFVPYARELLASSDAAVAAARRSSETLRVDVWCSRHAPAAVTALVCRQERAVDIVTTSRRCLASSLAAVQRREIDAAFGRVQNDLQPWSEALEHRLVVLERLSVAVWSDHPLAGTQDPLHPAALQEWHVWWPLGDQPIELLSYAQQLSAAFGVAVDTDLRGAGAVSPIQLLEDDPARVTLWGGTWPVPGGTCTRIVPLEPTPLLPWSLIWRSADPHPVLPRLLDVLEEVGGREGWLAHDPDRSWLPDTDLALLKK